MSVGNLVKAPYCEITATLELLDSLGVTTEDWASLRSASQRRREVIARLLKRDRYLEAVLTIEPGLTKLGAIEKDFLDLAVADDKLRKVLDLMRSSRPKNAQTDPVKQWEKFYLNIFGLTIDLSQVKLPLHHQGFNRLIIVAKWLTLNRTYDTCAKHFPCWRDNDDLNASVTVNDRTPTESYAIWVRDTVEADENLKSLSADDLKEDSVSCLTLTERLLYELKFFTETQKHLDKTNYTLCASSRDPNGYVPCVGWDPFCGGVCVRWDGSRDRRSGGRARQVVS